MEKMRWDHTVVVVVRIAHVMKVMRKSEKENRQKERARKRKVKGQKIHKLKYSTSFIVNH